MRGLLDQNKLAQFMQQLAKSSKRAGTVYFTGGVTAMLLGIRQQTIDIDLKFDPEPPGVFDSIKRLKEELQINIELAAPDHFIPPLPGWKERSALIEKIGEIEYRHYDLYAQALSKIERGHDQDIKDVDAYAKRGLVDKKELVSLFNAIKPNLIRYPAIDAEEFEKKVQSWVAQHGG